MPETTDPQAGATPPQGTPSEPRPPGDEKPEAAGPEPARPEAAKPLDEAGPAGAPEAVEPADAPAGGAEAGASPEPRPSLRSMLLVLVPVGLFLAYGLIAAFISGRYPSRAIAYRDRILKAPSSQDSSEAALELAEMSVGQRLEIVRDGFGLPEGAWERLPAGEGTSFDSPPLEAEEWRLTVNDDTRPLFLVVHGTVVDWRKDQAVSDN